MTTVCMLCILDETIIATNERVLSMGLVEQLSIYYNNNNNSE